MIKENAGTISILYLDDETQNLSAFKASFRRKYDVHIADNASSAEELLEEVKPHIIIADQRMPGMTGVDFFEKIKVQYPDSTRILLTAYTSSQTVIDAVNKGQIDRYLVKPWNNELMESTLEAGFTMYKAKVELRIKNEKLKKINSELNRFVYSVSHDLRAPLMSLLGLIDLVKIENNPEEQSQYFDMMEKSVKKMDNYIQTTLDYYRNFKTEIHIKPIDVAEMTHEITESLSSYNTSVKFKTIFKGKSQMFTDKMRLKITLSNLISNAVKYGNKGSSEYIVEIDVDINDDRLKASVRDHGMGIPANEQSKVFEMFYRTTNNSDPKSTGLGLYLVREAVGKMNGEISVTSNDKSGTCFTFSIPNQKNATAR